MQPVRKHHLNAGSTRCFPKAYKFFKEKKKSDCLKRAANAAAPFLTVSSLFPKGMLVLGENTLKLSLRGWDKPDSCKTSREHEHCLPKEEQTWWVTNLSSTLSLPAFLANELIRAESNDTCKQMTGLGMSHCPLFILYKHLLPGLVRLWEQGRELIFWATSSWNPWSLGTQLVDLPRCQCPLNWARYRWRGNSPWKDDTLRLSPSPLGAGGKHQQILLSEVPLRVKKQPSL